MKPDPEGMNDDRASWAGHAVESFGQITNMIAAGEENDTILCDLLCDLMHWCDREKIDFYRMLSNAQMHYREETKA